MYFFVKKIFCLALTLCVLNVNALPFAKLLAPLKYIYQENTFERRLPDGRVQRLHTGSDQHERCSYEAQQVKDLMQHITDQPRGTAHVINERHLYKDLSFVSRINYNINEFCKNQVRAPLQAIYYKIMRKDDVVATHLPEEGFLRSIHSNCLREGISTQSVEFRETALPPSMCGSSTNNHTVGEVLDRWEAYTEEFKQRAIDQGILTKKDFNHFYALQKQLAPFRDQTMNTFYDGKDAQQAMNSPIDSPLRKFWDTANTLLEQRALYEVCTDKKNDNLYLNMGGYHIDQLKHKLADKKWLLVSQSGINSEQAVCECDTGPKRTAVILAEHFKNLPPRGQTLQKTQGLFNRIANFFGF